METRQNADASKDAEFPRCDCPERGPYRECPACESKRTGVPIEKVREEWARRFGVRTYGW